MFKVNNKDSIVKKIEMIPAKRQLKLTTVKEKV